MIIAIIISIFIVLLILNYVLPHLIKKLWSKKLLNWASDQKKIFLTFDDGPDSSNTSKILDILKKNNVKATFFVIGENAEKYPELIKRIHKEGHTVCVHSQQHLHPWKSLPWSSMWDLMKGVKSLQQYGIKTRYIRPPYGKINFLSLLYIILHRLIFVHWNLDTHDYKQSDFLYLSQWLKEEIKIGKIVLLHDGRRAGTNSGFVTVKSLDEFFNSTNISPRLFSPFPVNGI